MKCGLTECGQTNSGYTDSGLSDSGSKDVAKRNAAHRNAAKRNGIVEISMLSEQHVGTYKCYNIIMNTNYTKINYLYIHVFNDFI